MIALFCTIGVDKDITNLSIVSHFLNFYTRQGINDFYFILQSNSNCPARIQETKSLLQEFKINEKFIWKGGYTAPLLNKYMQQAVNSYNKNDWIILADIDEFHNFPVRAKQFLSDCNKEGINCVKGHLIDKVAEKGELKLIQKEPRIDRQFPHAADLTKKIALGNTGKIVALKQPLAAGNGHHAIVKKKRNAQYSNQIIDVHHFKWDSLVLKRLQKRYRYYVTKKIKWYRESERVSSYLIKHGRILEDNISIKFYKPLNYFDR